MKDYETIFKDKTKKDIRKRIIRILKQFNFDNIETEFYGREDQHHLVFKMKDVGVDYYIECKEKPISLYYPEDCHPDNITSLYFAFSEEFGDDMINGINFKNIINKKKKIKIEGRVNIIKDKITKVLERFDYLGDIKVTEEKDENRHHLIFTGKGIKANYYIKDEDIEGDEEQFVVVSFVDCFCPWSSANIAIEFEGELGDIVGVDFGQIS